MIYVIDSSDRERLEEAKGELVKLLGERELKDAIILILLSKQVKTNFGLFLLVRILIQWFFFTFRTLRAA